MPNLKPRTATVVIYQGDDLERLAELRRDAEVARRRVVRAEGTPLRAGDAHPSAEAEETAYDEFVAVAAERALVLKVGAIGRLRFQGLLSDHPPRQVDETVTDDDGATSVVKRTHPEDQGPGVNTATFPRALLDLDDGKARTILEPEFTTTNRAAFLDDELSEGDFDVLWATAYSLNRSPAADPKASLYLTGSPRSTET